MLVPLSDADGPPLGVYPRATYHHRRIALEPGDLLVLYSDGLTAAQNGRGQLFGCGRLDDLIQGAADGGSAGVGAAVQDSLDDFRGGVEPEDDVMLLVLEKRE